MREEKKPPGSNEQRETGPEQTSVRSLKARSKRRGTCVSIMQAAEFKLTTRVNTIVFVFLVDWASLARHD